MYACLSLVASVVALGFVLHRVRIRVVERRLAARVASELRSAAEAKAAAERRVDELAALDTAKSRILSGLIDELRTPVLLLSAPLQRRDGARRRLEAEGVDVPGMLEQAGQLKHRIDQLGAILGVELGQPRLQASLGDFVALLARRVAALRPVAERYGAQVDFDAAVDHVWFSFDRTQVEHVLDALFRRVFEDTSPGDRVRISVARRSDAAGDQVVVEVFDTGRRIAEPHRRLLCDDVHWASHPEAIGDGVGLALALANRFVRLHGGTLRVDGEGHFGTRVQVALPLHAPAAPSGDGYAADEEAPAPLAPAEALDVPPHPAPEADEEEAEEGAGAEAKKPTVLVVDDHEGTRGVLTFALRRHYRVLEAANGQEALTLVRDELPDLVVSDIMMPVMDGQALCRAIKGDPALNHIPVFLVTANGVPDVKREGLESGADDYLLKPFDLEEALMRIHNMITLRSQLRRRFSREVVIKPSDITVSSADEAFLERARRTVETHMEEGDFGVTELAAELGLSPRQLQRRLRETVGQSPVEFIRTLRLQRAAQLLERQYGNVSEVAYSVGFTSLSYFAKCFREQFGRSPSEFKAEQSV